MMASHTIRYIKEVALSTRNRFFLKAPYSHLPFSNLYFTSQTPAEHRHTNNYPKIAIHPQKTADVALCLQPLTKNADRLETQIIVRKPFGTDVGRGRNIFRVFLYRVFK